MCKIKTVTNNYKRAFTGKTDYSVTLSMRMEGNDMKSLFEETTPFSIVVTDSLNVTITYSNMLPVSSPPEFDPSGLSKYTITFSAPAFNAGIDNRVLS